MRAKTSSNYATEGEPGSQPRTFSVSGHVLTAPKPVPGLYLVATPIGNLGDVTLRALETLAGVDIIACEDTRITRRLTERYAITAQLKPYHEHNAAMARPKILEKLAQGASIALVAELARDAERLETRGEFVLVIGPPQADALVMTQDALDDLLRSSLQRDSVKDSVVHAVELSGRPRREVYARALELAKEAPKKARGGDGED